MDLKEFGNSINKILNERLTSPFYGTFIVSWLIINWKIVYLTLFVDSNEVKGTKIDFIIANYSDKNVVIIYPIITTFLLITVFPFITYLAYWANLYYGNLRKNRKNKFDNSRMITLKESNEVRRGALEIENSFNKLLENKNSEIDFLKSEVNRLQQISFLQDSKPDVDSTKNESSYNFELDFEKLLENKQLLTNLGAIVNDVNSGKVGESLMTKYQEDINILLTYEIIQESGLFYKFTSKGNKFIKRYYEEKEN